MMGTGHPRHVERFTHGVQMKPNDAWSQAHGRYPAFGGQTPYRRFAHLKNLGELSRGQKLFPLRHNLWFGLPRCAIVAQRFCHSNKDPVFSETRNWGLTSALA